MLSLGPGANGGRRVQRFAPHRTLYCTGEARVLLDLVFGIEREGLRSRTRDVEQRTIRHGARALRDPSWRSSQNATRRSLTRAPVDVRATRNTTGMSRSRNSIAPVASGELSSSEPGDANSRYPKTLLPRSLHLCRNGDQNDLRCTVLGICNDAQGSHRRTVSGLRSDARTARRHALAGHRTRPYRSRV